MKSGGLGVAIGDISGKGVPAALLMAGLYPAPFTEAQLGLQKGDPLLGFTDGISECVNKDEEEWGEQRLMQAIRDCRGLDAKAIIERLMAAADAFADGAKQHDDMTLLVVKLEG